MKIIYTYTDEAPALATRSLLPILRLFLSRAGVEVESWDISLAGRILAAFNDLLPAEHRVVDALGELGALVKTPDANVIKLPNVSASIPQLRAAVAELVQRGYDLPPYPDDARTEDEVDAKGRYDSVKGSAVNPVLREGNSDRRAPNAVKAYARSHPHPMGAWSPESMTHVATMGNNDFRSNEQAVTVAQDTVLRIEHVAADGTTTVLRPSVPVLAGEIFDGTWMSVRALREFLAEQIFDAREQGVLFSLHMKATMMKVSDPIIFGHAVEVFFADVFEKHGAMLAAAGANVRDGWADVLSAIGSLPEDQQEQIQEDIEAAMASRPDLAMVDSDRGITNLHVPSDIIVDASMPAMIRASGQMWNKDGEQQDTKAVIPDSSYAALYQAAIDHCREHGAFDPATMGTVPNVGLMAQQAEEYGSHDKTFEVPADGVVRVLDAESQEVLIEQPVEAGDIWRACQAKDEPIRDWVSLAVRRARATGWPAVFWLDETRAHDAEVLKKVNTYLADEDTDDLDIRVMDVGSAARFSLERARKGQNTISVTGNVLRDYLTDLFPILELGTSAKMLSIVPLMNGGGLFETGAGGSAPKHVKQLVRENHLRWDSLGEFMALGASLELLAEVDDNARAKVLADALDVAVGKVLDEQRSPSRKVNEPDNRSSHAWLAMYWSRALLEQTDDPDLAQAFGDLAVNLEDAIDTIEQELLEVQGEPVDLGGYHVVDEIKADAVMRPSKTLNTLIDGE